jgi:hypothetical protein
VAGIACVLASVRATTQAPRVFRRSVALARVTTRPGARTGLWEPAQNRLFVAVPARGGAPAEIRIFEAP